MADKSGDLKPEDQFDLLKTLRDSAWDDFVTRRAFEWKLALSLWTAMAAFSGALLAGRVQLASRILVPVVFMAGLVLTVLHTIFVWGISRANKLNRDRQFFIEDQMMSRLGLSYPKEITEQIASVKKHLGTLWNWSHGFQLGVTIFLACGAVLAALVADP